MLPLATTYFPYAIKACYGLLAYAAAKGAYIGLTGYSKSKNLATGQFTTSLKEIESKDGGYFKVSKKHRINHKYMRESLGVIAPSGSGKTTALILNNLLDDKLPPCSKVIFDPKAEIWNLTHRYRESLGEKCILFDPLNSKKVIYNPLEHATSFQEVRELAERLLHSSIEKNTDTTFQELSKPLLTAILLYTWYCKENDLNCISTAIKILNLPMEDLDNLLLSCPDKKVIEQYNLFKQGKKAENTTDCIKLSVANALQLYSDPKLAKVTTGKSSFNASTLRETPTNLYISYAFNKADYIRPYLNIFLSQLLEKSCYENAKYPILYIIDEVQNIGKIPQLDKYLNIGRHYDIMIFLAMQNITKMYELYGKNETMTILNALQTKVVLGGISDTDFLQYVSTLSGDREIIEYDKTTGKEVKYTRKLMTADEVRRIEKNTGIIVSHNEYFVKDKLDHYYDNEKYLDNALMGVEFK